MRKKEPNDRAKNENVSGSHTCKVKELFCHALSEEIWVSIDELNEEICQESELRTPYKVAKLNVLTRSMLEYDHSYFSEDSVAKPEDYRPYFYSYIIQANSSSAEKAYERLRKMGDRWFLASFSKKFVDEQKRQGKWREYQGEIESSASPVIYRKRHIYISDINLDPAIVNEINHTYKIKGPTPDRDIEAKLTALLKGVQFTSSRVYAVGNGNLINITDDKKGKGFNLIYDVGYHSRQCPYDKRFTYGAAVRSFRHIVPNVVFLSHWDDDHIMGCVYGRSELFDCPWVAPEIVKKSAISAKRLAAYLSTKNKLIVVKREDTARRFAKVVTTNSTVSFYLGENKSKQSITKENCGGMVIEIVTRTDEQTVESLFCGDVPYEAVKTVIWGIRSKGYDNLVVPHHGSAMECGSLKIKQPARAVVCGNGSKSRPEGGHREALEASGAGYQVEVTEYAKGHPWIDLELQ